MTRNRTPAHCRDDWAGIDSPWSPVELTRFWAMGELELRIEAGLASRKNVRGGTRNRLSMAQILTFSLLLWSGRR